MNFPLVGFTSESLRIPLEYFGFGELAPFAASRGGGCVLAEMYDPRRQGSRSKCTTCIGAWRASYLWTVYLIQYQGFTLNENYARGAAMDIGATPLAGFLGRSLTMEYAD